MEEKARQVLNISRRMDYPETLYCLFAAHKPPKILKTSLCSYEFHLIKNVLKIQCLLLFTFKLHYPFCPSVIPLESSWFLHKINCHTKCRFVQLFFFLLPPVKFRERTGWKNTGLCWEWKIWKNLIFAQATDKVYIHLFLFQD